MIEIFTDGSSRGNPGNGGYAAILRSGVHYKELSAGYLHTTNNRMELMAVIAGLEALKKPGETVVIYSDSRYVIDPIEKNWLKRWEKTGFRNKKNADLWKRLLGLLSRHTVSMVWVRGHSGHPENERCDLLAVEAAKGDDLISDQGYLLTGTE